MAGPFFKQNKQLNSSDFQNITDNLNLFKIYSNENTLKNLQTDDGAVLEANFAGKQIGDFAGIPATGKEVKVSIL